MKLGTQTGSLVNHMMSSNAVPPKAGEGATVLMWSDRHAYEVIEVSENGKRCKIQRYKAERSDSNGMSECQDYKYQELEGAVIDLVFRNGHWRRIREEVVFTNEMLAQHEYPAAALTEQQTEEIYRGNTFPQTVVEGITRKKTTYPKINIVFGMKQEYYDYSF